MKRLVSALIVLLAVGSLTACVVPDPGPTGRYLGIQPDIRPVITPRAEPITWGAAPVIDDRYGGVLYEGTSIEMQDPRPALLPGGLEPLRAWVADPHDGVAGRPAIIWLHGGGFAVGIDSMYGLANGIAADYARRGYVGFSMEYRTDTTLMGEVRGDAERPKSLCQWVQDNADPDDPEWVAQRDTCLRNIRAAQHDALAMVRWVRANADRFGVDPTKVAIAGFSAGAVTASNAALQSDDVGDVAYWPGDTVSPASSEPQAAIGASGCTYTVDGSAPSTVDPGDAPLALIASRGDAAVPYDCVAATVQAARSVGLVAELTSYCDESLHAQKLYLAHREATDTRWTTFLARQLNLYTGMRAPTADPVCN
jgi:acetyl esterase/lipase